MSFVLGASAGNMSDMGIGVLFGMIGGANDGAVDGAIEGAVESLY